MSTLGSRLSTPAPRHARATVERRYLPLVPARVAELRADSLVEALAAVAGVQRLPAKPPLRTAALLARIEVASTAPSDEPVLRRAWRERRGGGALPLLLIADDRLQLGRVLVLGPSDPAAPLRTVDAAALHAALIRVATLPPLEAVRELADELTRLDQAGIPGLRVRELLTQHTLDIRLRNDAQRWSAMGDAVAGVGAGADWQSVLRGLGYRLERRPLYGHLVKTAEGRRVAVVHPKASPAELTRLDADGRPPEGRLLNDCAAEGVDYGILAHQGRLRLFDAGATGTAATRYLELDAALLRPDDRPFLALLAPPSLVEGGLRRLEDEARSFGTALRARLDQTIRQTVLPALAHAAGRWARAHALELADDAVREELERAALTLVFRCLFLLYAESAGHLPVDNLQYRNASLTALAAEAHETRPRLGERSTALWDRLTTLVRAMRAGNPAWGVPAYNGDLFAADGFEGSRTLERLELRDPDTAAVLVGLGVDAESGRGVDYSTLEIGNLGHIYEGLLSLRLSVASVDLRYDARADRYTPAAPGDPVDVPAGDLLWQTNEGGRKGAGVYYTPSTLVRHLVAETVRPAFAAHLERVRATAATHPAAATAQLLDFAVLDPSCGSAHFLVAVVAELADQVVRFLAQTPLPQVRAHLDSLRAGALAAVPVEDVALLRRLVLKHCVHGVDLSPMGAEIAKLSLWLASFVPGLSLAYLGRNVVVGNALIGVARPEALRDGAAPRPRRRRGPRSLVVADEPTWWEAALTSALAEATAAVAAVADSDDRTPDEVDASHEADRAAERATTGLRMLFDLWTAEPFGVEGARAEVELRGGDVLRGAGSALGERARGLAEEHRFLHWPTAFPRVFSRERPGFDAVVGNPPWEQVMVKEAAFYSLFRPGLVSLPESARLATVETLLRERPHVGERFAAERRRTATERGYYAAGEYTPMPGHPDLYKLFCQRYRVLARDGGMLGVVLPRTTFATSGSAGFRRWLFEESACRRIDFLLNKGCWMFDSEPRYTIALVAAERARTSAGATVRLAGTASSASAWDAQRESPGVPITAAMTGPGWTLPLLRNPSEARILERLRQGASFPLGSRGRWRCFAVQELNETFDRDLWQNVSAGWQLWKGESFDQYAPTGAGARPCPPSEAVMHRVRKSRPGADSAVAGHSSLEARRAALAREVGACRVAFRDVARATDSRTVRACLVPPRTFLTNTAPYLAFVADGDRDRAACLGVMNSLPFDWQARRFVEIHLNFFILEALGVPDLDDDAYAAVAGAAARLSCVDERFSDFAASTGVDVGPLDDETRMRLRAEIDARVAHAWGLADEEVTTMLADFTLDAVPQVHRDLLRRRLVALSAAR